jgi:sugar phosphate isomerase/epimerase
MTHTLAINTIDDELEETAEFCRFQGIGIEITGFASPSDLDENVTVSVKRHKGAVSGISPVISHGPFLDLVATSVDPAIVEVSRKRHQASLEAAEALGVNLYIGHTNFNASIRDKSYRQNFTPRMLKFWLPLANWAARRNIVICLENLWEPGPEVQAELVMAAAHPSLKASFDNGHALVFSGVPASRWIETLGEHLAHCHLHDNHGELDEHNPIGDGKENWPDLLSAARKYAPQAVLVAESSKLTANKISLERLRTL